MEPATRMQRFLGSLIDGFALGLPYALAGIELLPDPVRLLGAVAAAGLIGAQLYFLVRDGQTIGKKVIGTRVVLKDTMQNGGFVPNVLKRGFVNGLLSLIPGYFLVDSLFVFREDRRCVHDLIAGTIVVQGAPAVVQ